MAALITGANRGIGRAIYDRMRDMGRPAIGTSRRGAPPFLPLDVTEPRSCAMLADRLTDQPIDLLVCNAGIYPDKKELLTHGYPPQMWAETFSTNVTGVFLVIQAMLPNLRAQRGSKIAIISSSMGRNEAANGGSYIYRASKAAALNLGRNLASDLKADHIAVGIYHPGWVHTQMGGTQAPLAPEESARGLVERFDRLSLDTTGIFESWDGCLQLY